MVLRTAKQMHFFQFENVTPPSLTENIIPHIGILAPVPWNLIEEIQQVHV